MTAHKKPNGEYAADTLKELRKVAGGKDMTVMAQLTALTEGLYERFGKTAADREARTPEVDWRWADLLDLMYYFDEDANRDKPVHARVGMPDADPLTLINRLQDEGFINKKDGNALRRKFNDQVKALTGRELNNVQVAELRRLLLDFDVGQTLRPAEEKREAPETPGQG